MTEEYISSSLERHSEILDWANDFKGNPEVYFSSMMGRQFKVLDRGCWPRRNRRFILSGERYDYAVFAGCEVFQKSILAGKFPGWNPWIMAGMPYFLDPQNFLWYPPNYFLLITPLEIGFFVLLIGHLVFAGWGIKKILEKSGISGRLGLLGAGMFMSSPKIIGHIEEGNWSLVIAACWLPFFYWALKIEDGSTGRRWHSPRLLLII